MSMLMGLAPTASPSMDSIYDKLLDLRDDGSFRSISTTSAISTA